MKKNSSATDNDFKLWILIRQTRDVIYRARDEELSPYGITNRQAAVLFTIDQLGGEATTAEIARWQLRESHSITGTVSRMVKDGLITKSKDMPKKNWVRITMTKKGRKAYLKSLKRESISRIMSPLSKTDRKQLISCLEVVRDSALKELGVKYKPPFPKPTKR